MYIKTIFILFLSVLFFTCSNKKEKITLKNNSKLNTLETQKPKTINALIGLPFDFSQEVLDVWATKDSLQQLLDKKTVNYKDLTPLQQKVVQVLDMPVEHVWSVLSWCKWSGQIYYESIKASSTLVSQNKTNYFAKNVGDLTYQTVWVEGVKGYGIGEFIEFELSTSLAELNTVIIANGYIKDKKTWKNNSRVKQLKMYVDDEFFAILNLKDVYASQIFKIPAINYSDKENEQRFEAYYIEKTTKIKPKSKKIRFKISAVYKGDKYADTAITEIYFEGQEEH